MRERERVSEREKKIEIESSVTGMGDALTFGLFLKLRDHYMGRQQVSI